MKKCSFTGFVAATHTPFHPDSSLNLGAVEKQAAHLLSNGVTAVFIGGTTGESQSLSLSERLDLTKRWVEVSRGTPLRIVVHVGANSLGDARALAADAQRQEVAAIAAIGPTYFKPATLEALIACSANVAAAAPATPFYYYDIPSLTGISLSAADFLTQGAEAIPTLAGAKLSNPDMLTFQHCLRARDGAYDILFGCDEFILSALVLGGAGGVGSTYNFAAPIYHRLLKAFNAGDLAAAREEQWRTARMVRVLARFGSMAASKATMKFLGVDIGPARLPHANLDQAETEKLKQALDELGFFKWVR